VIVDVIIPVFNGARFVRRAVESVLAQEPPAGIDVELTVVLIDDGSTDGSWGVLGALAAADPRVHIRRNPVNLGVAATRNSGVRESTADLIAFLDQDDAWCPGKLALQVEALRSRPELGYVVGLQAVVVEPGESRPAWCRPEWLEGPQAGFLPSALLVRREVFVQVGFLDEELRAGGDDVDWFARARRLGIRHDVIGQVVFTRYVHDRNTSSSPDTNDDLLAAVRRHLGRPGATP
jgi:glycosyltransferase involved in cell wall biosynthesis